MADIFDEIELPKADEKSKGDIFDQVATMPKPDIFDGLQMQTPTLAPEPPKNQFDLGAVMNVIGQQPIVQEVGQAVQSPGNFIEGLDRLESGIPLAVAQAGDVAGGLSNFVTDNLSNATEQALGPQIFNAKEFQSHVHAQTHGADALKKLLPPANSALAGLGATAATMAIPIGGGAKAGATIGEAALHGAAQMGGMAALQSLGEQYGQTGKIDVPQLAASTALGGVLGGAGSAVVAKLGGDIAKRQALGALIAKKNSPKRIEQLHLQELARTKQAALDNYHAANDLEIAADKARREAQVIGAVHEAEKFKREQALQAELARAAERDRRFREAEAKADAHARELEKQNAERAAQEQAEKQAKAAENRRHAGEIYAREHQEAMRIRNEQRKKDEYFKPIDEELAADELRRKRNALMLPEQFHERELKARADKIAAEDLALKRKMGIGSPSPRPEPKANWLKQTPEPTNPHPEQAGQSIREKAVDLRHTPKEVAPARPVNKIEHEHLRATLDAKLKADLANHHYEQAFDHLVSHLEHNGYTTEGAKIKAPDLVPPEIGEQIRKHAKELAGIEGPLRETKTSEPNLIRDENASDKFPDYEMQGKDSLSKTVEVKHLKQLANKFQDEYKAARDAAKIQSLLKPGEVVEVHHNGQVMRVENRTQVKYEPGKDASAKQKVEYKGYVEDGYKKYHQEADQFNDEFHASISGLKNRLKQTHPDLARILGANKPVIDDPRIIDAAEKLGVLPQVYQLLKKFAEDESGSAPTGLITDVLSSSSLQLLKAAKRGGKLARRFGLSPELTQRIAANEFTHDIYRRAANPVFVADYEKQLGELALATQGVELPRDPNALEAWFTLKKPQDILDNKFLTASQKAALIQVNEVKKKTASILKQEIADLYEKAEEAGEQVNPFTGYGAQIRAMKHDLDHNWERKHEDSLKIANNVVNFIAHNTVNSVQLGNVGLHFIHAVEGHVAFQSSSPWGFAQAMKSYVTRDKEALSFAHSFQMKMPQWGMREDAMNPITSGYAKAQNKILKMIPGSDSKFARTASDAISGRGMEQQKMVVGLLTASHVAAKEMNYPGGAKGLRQAIMNKTISDKDRLEAATHMMKFMGRTIGAGPAGYTHMNAIDRAAQEVGGIARIMAPFTRSIQTQSAFFNRELVDGANAMGKGDLPKAASHFATVLHGAAITAMWSGAATLPFSIRDSIGEHDPKKLEQLEETLDKCAILGNLLGIRSTHTRPEPMWYLRTGQNLISGMIENGKTLASVKDWTKPDQMSNKQRHAAVMMGSVLTGINNIADTLSFEVLAKIYGHYDEASKLGGNTQWVYTEAGPFGLSKGKYVASRLNPESPLEAVVKTAVKPGEGKDEAEFERRTMRNHLAEVAFKNTYGADVHKLLDTYMYKPHFQTSQLLYSKMKSVEKDAAKLPKEQQAEYIKMLTDPTAKAKQMEWRKFEEDGKVEFGDKQIPALDFWTEAFEELKQNPEKAAALRDMLSPSKPTNTGPSGPIAQN